MSNLVQPTPAKQAKSCRVLENWIVAKAGEAGINVGRLRRGLSYMVVSAALARARDSAGIPLFLIKGGVAMELRCGLSARASQDLDAAFRASFETFLEHLDEAITEDYCGFTIERSEPEKIGRAAAWRLTLKLGYRNGHWGKVRLEVSQIEGSAGDSVDWVEPFPDLTAFGMPKGEPIACLSIPYQVAQKLHACTRPHEDGRNMRVRDLVDLQLLDQLTGPRELVQIRKACSEVFELRDTHPWPPTIQVFEGWHELYRELASAADFPVAELDTAVVNVTDFIRRIDLAA